MSYCTYCSEENAKKIHKDYHDNHYGFPIAEDNELFGRLLLEINQAGLSWETILNKEKNFRMAYSNFDIEKVANYKQPDINRLLEDAGIIRNKLKIRSAITNAQLFMDVQQEFGSFSAFIWSYVDNEPIINKVKERKDLPATTPLSDKLSKDLKKRGFKFVGSTVMYAYMQAVGLVNDHTMDCFKYETK